MRLGRQKGRREPPIFLFLIAIPRRADPKLACGEPACPELAEGSNPRRTIFLSLPRHPYAPISPNSRRAKSAICILQSAMSRKSPLHLLTSSPDHSSTDLRRLPFAVAFCRLPSAFCPLLSAFRHHFVIPSLVIPSFPLSASISVHPRFRSLPSSFCLYSPCIVSWFRYELPPSACPELVEGPSDFFRSLLQSWLPYKFVLAGSASSAVQRGPPFALLLRASVSLRFNQVLTPII